MKRIMAWLALFALVLGLFQAMPAGAEEPSTLVVGHTTRLSGSFFTDMWGNNTSDIDVRQLLHGYPTIIWTEAGDLFANPRVVEEITRNRDREGNLLVKIKLYPNLRFSDGSKITAADYVFSIILQTSPLIRELGGQAVSKAFILGAEDYLAGKSQTITGLRLLGQRTFSITIDKEALPYFYDLAYAHAQPYPVAVIAPGCRVLDEGDGVYMDGPFGLDLLRQTILDPQTGYLSHPRVVSGPYQLDSFDRDSGTAAFSKNPYFRGNHEGMIPSIQHLVLKETKNETMLQQLGSGQLGLVNKISSGQVIDLLAGLKSSAVVDYASYPRQGLGFVAFGSEQGFTSSVKLRQAIAHLVDKDHLVQEFLHGHGQAVHAYYGIGQWMTRAMTGQLDQLDLYPHTLEEASRLMQEDGWDLNARGEAYQPGDGLRYRQAGDYLLPLKLRLGLSPDNAAGKLVSAQLEENLQRIGGQLSIQEVPMPQLLEHYYRQRDRDFDLLFLGSNFPFVFDPYYTYHKDAQYQGAFNTSGVQDDTLFQKAKELRETPSGNKALYLDRWLDFQRAWVQVLPLLPLYSNTYYDAFTPRLRNYHPEAHSSWAIAILYADME